MPKNKSISKNIIFNGILNLFNIILPILVMPIVSRAIGTELYGYMGYGDSLFNYFYIFASFGICTYGLREMSRIRDNKDQVQKSFTSLFIITLITNIIATIGYMLFVVITYKNEPYYYTCIVLGLNLAFNIFYVEWVNQALENYTFITVKTILIRVVSYLLIIFCVHNKDSYKLYLYIIVLTNLINNLVSFIYIKKEIKFDFSNLDFSRHIKFMFFAVILSNVGVLYTQLDKFMLKGILGTTSVGYYYMAQRIINMINVLMLTLVTVTIPRLSNFIGNNNTEEYILLLKKISKSYFLILFPATIGLICLSKEMIQLFGGAEYTPVVPVLIVFSIYMLSLGIQNIISNQIIYIHQQEKQDSVLIFIGGIINLILNFLLVFLNIFTATTVIATTVIANFITIKLQYGLAKKCINSDINLFSLDNMKYLIFSLGFIPITILVKRIIFNPIGICICVVFLCSLFYMYILYLSKDAIFLDIKNQILKKRIYQND